MNRSENRAKSLPSRSSQLINAVKQDFLMCAKTHAVIGLYISQMLIILSPGTYQDWGQLGPPSHESPYLSTMISK